METTTNNTSKNGKRHIAIAGGGMGGLTAALSLLKRGIDCTVYEQATELKELGAGLWLSINGARVLFDLGLEDEIRAVCLQAKDRVVRAWDTGYSRSVYNREDGGEVDHTLFMVLRSELHRIMIEELERIKPGAIQLNSRCVDVKQDENGVTLTFEDGRTATADALIGADGVHSRVRKSLFGEAPGIYTGAVAWRGLVPMSALPEHHREPIGSTWIGPAAHVTSYPVLRGTTEMMSFSGQSDHAEWASDSWSETGSVAECLKDFDGWHQDIVDLVTNAEILYKWGLFVREPLQQWSKGRVTLLGDACHSMVPYLGQGVNTALEDGCVLARCIEAESDIETALKRYEEARIPRTTKAVKKSAEMQEIFHHEDLKNPSRAQEYVNRLWSPERVRERYDWVFEYNANTVPV